MEQARRIFPEHDTSPAAERPAGWTDTEQTSEGIEKVLRFAMPQKADGDQAGNPRPMTPVTARDLASAIDFIHEAAAAMRAADERTREAENRTQALAQRAAEELKNAEMRIQALEARLRAAEARAQDSDLRANEADAWLRQIFTTIADELPARRPGQPGLGAWAGRADAAARRNAQTSPATASRHSSPGQLV